ncbi:AAA family ATPase [Mycolicibacterium sp. P9-64]|uniref:AAA family ATPase n=1 Tax=Mycolicibacterium sp. P9-64 TaxID=2024612 RepID=UPI001565F1D2|nr:AAA family ATPase [Mycolicibacterium sp. P9-64]
MRLNSIHLQPYGALSDSVLKLGDGLTVVHGLNEAGKSTLLYAYADLLCGIPRQTPMAFLAPRPRIRIQASVTLDNGSTVKVIRTSKNAPNDLLDAATSNPVAPEVRRALMHALDHNSVMTRFGLDHHRLVTGGRELMEGQGTLAYIVFEARSGTDVRTLVNRLEDRAASLYTPRRSTSDLVRANHSRDELDGKLKETMATAEAVEAAAARRTQVEADLEQRRLEAAHLQSEHARLTQLLDSWPYWEQYRARRDELMQVEASGPRLSSNELRTVTESFARLDEIDSEIRTETTTAEIAQQERSGLAVDENLLAEQPAIDTLGRDKAGAETSRLRATQLSGQAAGVGGELTELLRRLGLHDFDEPLAALASIAVADDRLADLTSLADEYDRLVGDLHQAQEAVNEANAQVQAAEREVETNSVPSELGEEVDPAGVASARQRRDVLWHQVRYTWLDGAAVPIEIGPGPDDLADRYEASVGDVDSAADDLLDEAGQLSDAQRKRIATMAAGKATVNERRRALGRDEQSLAEVKQLMKQWRTTWDGATDAAGLPSALGVAGWRERARLLSDAASDAENLRTLERERVENAPLAAAWDGAAAALAARLGQSVEADRLVAWFDKAQVEYERSKSNQKAAEVHRKNQSKAMQRAAQLRAESSTFEESLDQLAAENGVDRGELYVLVERTKLYVKAVAALDGPAGQLRARHPEATLDELTEELASRDREQLGVDLDATKDALSEADDAVTSTHEDAIFAKNVLAELAGRTGADELQQELSQATAQVLDIVEDCVTTRLMHHLLTQELRTYLESHRNPVLERAGSYLKRLTQGRFVGLRAEGESTDRSLVVVGADDVDYETTALSEGTASQLYLALSLAGVLEVEHERRDAGLETVPIMLDDVLMAFDDERAASALDLLAEIGEEQQIVLFTHHAAVKDRVASIAETASAISLAAPAVLV